METEIVLKMEGVETGKKDMKDHNKICIKHESSLNDRMHQGDEFSCSDGTGFSSCTGDGKSSGGAGYGLGYGDGYSYVIGFGCSIGWDEGLECGDGCYDF